MEPLAHILRPTKLDDIVGQKHLIGEDKILTNLVKNKKLFSMILYGKPGIGKTSIATAIVNELGYKYILLNAVINNKKDFDDAINEAKYNSEYIIIMDEIHRLNKDKQDLLLPYLENGLITLIGMTTSNPYHSINPAIRSRCQLIELKDLTSNDIIDALKKDRIKELLPNIVIDEECYSIIARSAGYDLRSAYNLLEIAYFTTTDHHITKEILKNIVQKNNVFVDKNEDGYYNLLSAFQKSIRGSDVNASIHYLARLLESDDLESVCRRLSVITYEDIGLAKPEIWPCIEASINSALRLGLPEARIPLGTVVTEMALSPKSNSAHTALDEALNDLHKGNTGNVPNHIKTNSKDYLYPHNYPNSYAKQEYMPANLKGKKYYHPRNNKYENNLNKLWQEMRNDK